VVALAAGCRERKEKKKPALTTDGVDKMEEHSRAGTLPLLCQSQL